MNAGRSSVAWSARCFARPKRPDVRERPSCVDGAETATIDGTATQAGYSDSGADRSAADPRGHGETGRHRDRSGQKRGGQIKPGNLDNMSSGRMIENGAGRGTRTPDIVITNHALYQLSYAGPWHRSVTVLHPARGQEPQAPEKVILLFLPPAVADQMRFQPSCQGTAAGLRPMPAPIKAFAAKSGGAFPARQARYDPQKGRGKDPRG